MDEGENYIFAVVKSGLKVNHVAFTSLSPKLDISYQLFLKLKVVFLRDKT